MRLCVFGLQTWRRIVFGATEVVGWNRVPARLRLDLRRYLEFFHRSRCAPRFDSLIERGAQLLPPVECAQRLDI